MSEARVCFVVNPHSAGGATGRRLGDVRRAADRHFHDWDVWKTRAPKHATELAARAVDEGFDLVVSVGGDGTANEVVNGLLLERERCDVAFSVLPAGTGSDLVKSIGIPRDIDEAMATIANGEPRRADATRVQLVGPHRESRTLVGMNVTGIGMAGQVVSRANRSSKRFGGTLTFLSATVRSAIRYTAPLMAIRWDGPDGEGEWEGLLSNAFVANGHYCGGGMWVGRQGTLDDGHVDVTIIPELPMAKMAVNGRRLYDGTMGEVDGVVTARATRITAEPQNNIEVLVDVDGEQPGSAPVTIDVLPGALLVRGRFAQGYAANS